MKNLKNATSIVESLVVVTIIVIWLTWVYNIYSKSMDLTQNVENKIQAIQIAREWIEAVTNIRDTNWFLFSADRENCWNTLNYDENCIWNPSALTRIWDWEYRIYKDIDNRWILEAWNNIADFSSEVYRNNYMVYRESNWLYTQNSSLTNIEELSPIYTRRIEIENIASTPNYPETFEWMLVKSIVNWSNDWEVSEIELETILTNYKK